MLSKLQADYEPTDESASLTCELDKIEEEQTVEVGDSGSCAIYSLLSSLLCFLMGINWCKSISLIINWQSKSCDDSGLFTIYRVALSSLVVFTIKSVLIFLGGSISMIGVICSGKDSILLKSKLA